MTQEEDCKARPAVPATERRKQPRTASLGNDWESIALRRVASRVESLPGFEADAEAGRPASKAPEGFGWEEVVLRNLRRRLKDRGSS